MKRITLVCGHYGSGKTNFALNLAVNAAKSGEKITLVDLDIVNPYFRTADFKDMFENMGIQLIAPDVANSNLDIPSIQFDVVQLAMNEDCLIIDVGGDDAGAVALGRYADELAQFKDDIDMLYVINFAKRIFFEKKRQWNHMIDRGMEKDFSWGASKFRYEGLYRYLTGKE